MISLGFSEIPLVEEFGQEMRQKEEATGRIPLKNPQKPPQKQPYFGSEVRQKKKAIGKIPLRKTPSKTALFWLRNAPKGEGEQKAETTTRWGGIVVLRIDEGGYV
ncbi:MAG: hypothetical protein QXP49_02860 [Nitrososphaerota archaeon]